MRAHYGLLLFNSIFFGFAVLQWMLFFMNIVSKTTSNKSPRLSETSVWMVKYTGILFIIFWPVLTYYWSVIPEYSQFHLDIWIEKLTGKYWIWNWLQPILMCLLTQVMWIKKVRKSKITVLSISIMMLVVMGYNRFVIIVTNAHRDYVTMDLFESIFYNGFFTDWIIMFMIFGVLLFIFNMIFKPNN